MTIQLEPAHDLGTMRIRRYESDDWDEWRRMSHALAPSEPIDEVERGMRNCLARDDAAVFVLDREAGGALAGYVEVGARSHADACVTSPVGYVEALYVDPDVRRNGHGAALLAAAEDWARARGYREMASDAVLENFPSHEAHRKSGYLEVGRVVQYRKEL